VNRKHKWTMGDHTEFFRPATMITPQHEIDTEAGWRQVTGIRSVLVEGRQHIQFELEDGYQVDPVQPDDGIWSRAAKKEARR